MIEPIWFNRFLYLKTDSKHGRFLKKETEFNLISKGFLHLSDLLTPLPSAGSTSLWLSREAAILKANFVKLGPAIFSAIDLLLPECSGRKSVNLLF